MKILPILILLVLNVASAYVINYKIDPDDSNLINMAEKAMKEIYDKHRRELKNFGPFLEEYYRNLPKVDLIQEDEEKQEVPLQMETVFADPGISLDDFHL